MVNHCHPRGWRSLAFRGYVEIADDIVRDISKLLVAEVAYATEEDVGGTSLGFSPSYFAPYELGIIGRWVFISFAE